MSFRLKQKDCDILMCIAEHRMLTISQIAIIFEKSKPVISRRMRNLDKAGLVKVIRYELGRARGRPEGMLGLTGCGIDILKEKELINIDLPYEKI